MPNMHTATADAAREAEAAWRANKRFDECCEVVVPIVACVVIWGVIAWVIKNRGEL